MKNNKICDCIAPVVKKSVVLYSPHYDDKVKVNFLECEVCGKIKELRKHYFFNTYNMVWLAFFILILIWLSWIEVLPIIVK